MKLYILLKPESGVKSTHLNWDQMVVSSRYCKRGPKGNPQVVKAIRKETDKVVFARNIYVQLHIRVAPYNLSTKQMHVNYNALLALSESLKLPSL